MLCCAGLIGGVAVGQYLGGPWTLVAPAAGFGLGLWGDMKFMGRMHGRGHQHHRVTEPIKELAPERDDARPPGAMEVGPVESDAGKAQLQKGA